MSDSPEILLPQERIINIRVNPAQLKAAARFVLIEPLATSGIFQYTPIACTYCGGPTEDAVTLQGFPRPDLGHVMQFDFLHQMEDADGGLPYYGQGITAPVVRFSLEQTDAGAYQLYLSRESLNCDSYSDKALKQAFQIWFNDILLEACRNKTVTFEAIAQDIPTLKILLESGFKCVHENDKIFANVLTQHPEIDDAFAIPLVYQIEPEATLPLGEWC